MALNGLTCADVPLRSYSPPLSMMVVFGDGRSNGAISVSIKSQMAAIFKNSNGDLMTKFQRSRDVLCCSVFRQI